MKLIRKRSYNPAFPTFFDDFFTKDLFGADITRSTLKTTPAVNILERDTHFGIELAAPGFSKEDFNLEVENDLLTISFEKRTDKDETSEDGSYTRREFNYSSFKRSFNLPEGVIDIDAIEAKYENGLLTLTLPKLEEVQAKAKRTIAVG